MMVLKVILLCAACSKQIDTSRTYFSQERGRAVCPECAGKTGFRDSITLGVKPPSCKDLALEKANSEGITGLLPGEQNELHTRQLVRETHKNFLQIGKLLKKNRDNAWWSTCGHGSFSEYIESLGISKSSGYKMIACFQASGKLSEEEILEIGISKMELLVSSGKVDDVETVELAKSAPYRDFKEYLGHKLLTNDPNYSIICPRCNVAIEGATWVRLKK